MACTCCEYSTDHSISSGCHIYPMLLTNSENDKINSKMLSLMRDLKKYKLPSRIYYYDDDEISAEIKKRRFAIINIMENLQNDVLVESSMTNLLCRIRSQCLGYERFKAHPNFRPSIESLQVIEKELPYFGFMWGTNLELAGLFLYDICISLTYRLARNAIDDYTSEKRVELDKKCVVSVIKDYIDNPPQNILDSFIVEVVYFFMKNQ